LDQYTAVNSVSPSYDGNGNLTGDGVFAFGYDAESRMTGISGGGVSASYAYDGRGRRKSKTVGATTTITITDADDRALLDYDGATGALGHWYTYGPGLDDQLNAMNLQGGTRQTLIPDIQGTVMATLDSSSGTLSKANTLPYGENPGATSGLYYYRARMYSPTLGRFVQVDPIGFGGGDNLYAYVGNDPLNNTDQFGLRADVYVYPMSNGQQGYSFVAIGDNPNSEPVTGHFNVTTSNSVSLPIGTYTLSPRPHIDVKTGVAGVLQTLNSMLSYNALGDVNRHEGVPVLSNTADWNTIQLPSGVQMHGVEIHPGSDPTTGEGGRSAGCLVCSNVDFGNLNQMLKENYNNGGAYLHMK
jgi:RHS repeat-associated protein